MTTVQVGDRPVATAPPLAAPSSPDLSLASRLVNVARQLEWMRSNRQRGPLAELRRLRSDMIPGEAFWDLMQRFDIPPVQEPFWRAVLPLMTRHPHRLNVQPGRVIELAGVSKPRFERWLRLDREGARREAGRLLSKLDDQGFDWVKFGRALYRWNDDDRYRLARDFFLARERREHAHTDGAE